jgi:hypothetical protein
MAPGQLISSILSIAIPTAMSAVGMTIVSPTGTSPQSGSPRAT